MIEILERKSIYFSNNRGSSDNYLHEMEFFLYMDLSFLCCKMKEWYMKLPLIFFYSVRLYISLLGKFSLFHLLHNDNQFLPFKVDFRYSL